MVEKADQHFKQRPKTDVKIVSCISGLEGRSGFRERKLDYSNEEQVII